MEGLTLTRDWEKEFYAKEKELEETRKELETYREALLKLCLKM